MTRIRLAHLAFIVTRVLAVGLLSLPLQTRGQAVTPSLPPEISQALQKAGIPAQSVSFWVAPLNSQGAPALGGAPRPLLAWRAQAPMNPASVMKLLTTSAALDLLGPDFTWHTPVYADGTLQDGVLRGNLYLQGQGDPTLVVERLWLLLQRVRQWGVEQIQGDIVLDRSAFAPEPVDPGEFDAAPLRPYNVPANALLLNFRAWSATFSPDPNKPIAHVLMNPPLMGVQVPLSVPLTGGTGGTGVKGESGGACGDWRSQLQAHWDQPLQLSFNGSYPAACGERVWSMAYADPAQYDARLLAALWQSVGGRLEGKVRDGKVPSGLSPWFNQTSPPLAEVVRDINKFSNNVMAQQLFLTLSWQATGQGSTEASRQILRQWWASHVGQKGAMVPLDGDAEPPVVDNGSGLSRQSRVSAQALGALIHQNWRQGAMPEWLASLPLVGVDGTLKRLAPSDNPSRWGAAHLKSGSLRDVSAVAGVVRTPKGNYFAVVAIANQERAAGFPTVVQALLDWLSQSP